MEEDNKPIVMRCKTTSRAEYLIDFYGKTFIAKSKVGAKGEPRTYAKIVGLPNDLLREPKTPGEIIAIIEECDDTFNSIKPGKRLGILETDGNVILSTEVVEIVAMNSITGKELYTHRKPSSG